MTCDADINIAGHAGLVFSQQTTKEYEAGVHRGPDAIVGHVYINTQSHIIVNTEAPGSLHVVTACFWTVGRNLELANSTRTAQMWNLNSSRLHCLDNGCTDI